MRALLDMNVLIALLDSDHLHHTRAMAWLPENNSGPSSLTWSPLGLPGIQLVTVRRVKIAAIPSDFDRGDASVPDGIR
jgi:predicted nucleic acid-binding protein